MYKINKGYASLIKSNLEIDPRKKGKQNENENVKEYLLNNIEELKELVEEINGYNNEFEDLAVYENDDEFFDLFFQSPMEAVRACYYGNYNYCDDYVKINTYGNVNSCNEWEYEEELQSRIDDVIDYLENEEYFQETYKELIEKSEVEK